MLDGPFIRSQLLLFKEAALDFLCLSDPRIRISSAGFIQNRAEKVFPFGERTLPESIVVKMDSYIREAINEDRRIFWDAFFGHALTRLDRILYILRLDATLKSDIWFCFVGFIYSQLPNLFNVNLCEMLTCTAFRVLHKRGYNIPHERIVQAFGARLNDCFTLETRLPGLVNQLLDLIPGEGQSAQMHA